MPERVRIKWRHKGGKKPENVIVVARPSGWGNPFRVGELGVPDNATAVGKYREWFAPRGPGGPFQAARRFTRELNRAAAREHLRGHDLACYCRLCPAHENGLPLEVECPDCEPCHADVLLEIANG